MHIVAVVSCVRVVVGRVDIVVPLHLVFIHVDSAGVRLRLHVVGIACDVVSRGGGPRLLRLVGVAASVRLGQVGHAASVGVHVSSVAATSAVPVGVVSRSAVLHTGLAGVGGAVVEDVSAVAAPGGGHHKRRYGRLGFRRELRLGLQAAAPLTEVLRSVLRSTSEIKMNPCRLVQELFMKQESKKKMPLTSDVLPELCAAVGVAGEEGSSGHAAGVTRLSGSRFMQTVVGICASVAERLLDLVRNESETQIRTVFRTSPL